jgi:PAS domain S-box-containing protein
MKPRMFDPRWAPATTAGRYTFAVVACLLATVPTAILVVEGELEHPLSALVGAILLSGWYGGLGPAMLAIVLVIGIDRELPFILGYHDTLWIGVRDLWFFLFGAGAAWFGSARRRLMLELETARNDLQTAMLARTQDLQRKDKYLAAAEELSHLGSWASPLDPKAPRYWSAEFYRNLGLVPFSVQPSSELFWSFIHPDDREALQQRISTSISQLKRFEVEHRIVRANGEVRTIYGVGQPHFVDGAVREYIGVTMDVTELRAAQLAERRSRARTMRARFEARLSERNRLARELHDTLLQGFTGVSLQLLAATRSQRGPREDAEALEKVLTLAEHTLTDARRAIFNLRSPGTSVTLPDEVRGVVEETLANSRIRFSVDVTGRPRRVGSDTRHTILRVVGEAAMNAVKHSGARHLRVQLEYTAAQVGVIITDDGSGFVPADGAAPIEGHYGLIGMRERAKRLGGSLQVRSAPGAGTTICLIVRRKGTRADGKNDGIRPYA